MLILGIETSCDETAVALFDSNQGLLAHEVHSQIEIHREYGGVVPELASRDHIRKTLPLIHCAIDSAQKLPTDINGIAYTKGPGLVGALLVGASLAKSLAFGWKIPAIGLHHMESHLMVALLENPELTFPFVALLVSGGHTLLVQVQALGNYIILGESLDDAAGEAFDKVAKLLELANPNGAALAELAAQGETKHFNFPRPMLHQNNLNFSFSGLKTAVVRCYEKEKSDLTTKANIACEFQAAVAEILSVKCAQAIQQTGLNSLVVVGGVAANQKLRAELNYKISALGVKIFYPRVEYCTDNGVMVAYNGWLHLRENIQDQNLAIEVKSRWSMEEIL